MERLEKEMEYIQKKVTEVRAILDGFNVYVASYSKIITFRCDIPRIEQELEKKRRKKEEEQRKIDEIRDEEEKRRIEELAEENRIAEETSFVPIL